MNNDELGIIAVVVLLIGGIFLAHNFLGQIKTAPITLVPTGTQAATNPSSQTAMNAALLNNASNQYASTQGANTLANAAVTAAGITAGGAILSSAIDAITGGATTDESGYN